MARKKSAVTCMRCGWNDELAIINLASGEIFCKKCSRPLPLIPPPIPWRSARVDTTSVTDLTARVRSRILRRILGALGDGGYKTQYVYLDTDTVATDRSISRAIRRYNATLRKLNAGFQLAFIRASGDIVRSDTDD
jgi:hypothetical protein